MGHGKIKCGAGQPEGDEPESAAAEGSSVVTSQVPSMLAGVLYASKVAAATAALLTSAGVAFGYRNIRVVLPSTGQPELAGDFWVPEWSTMLFVYPVQPVRQVCAMHQEIAHLGFRVAVLVGAFAPPVRRTQQDPADGLKGWALLPFSAELAPGWCAFMDKGHRNNWLALGTGLTPWSELACSDRLVAAYRMARLQCEVGDSPNQASAAEEATSVVLDDS